MASFVLTDATFSIGGTDLSDHVRSITVNVSADTPENTAMSSDGWRSRLGGLKDWSVDVEFNQDFAASEIDATIFPLLGTSGAFIGKPTSDTTSATNPAYSGNVIISDYKPISNGVGDVATVSVSWPGNGALSRATS